MLIIYVDMRNLTYYEIIFRGCRVAFFISPAISRLRVPCRLKVDSISLKRSRRIIPAMSYDDIFITWLPGAERKARALRARRATVSSTNIESAPRSSKTTTETCYGAHPPTFFRFSYFEVSHKKTKDWFR